MTSKNELSKPGIAIERARSIIDQAMPRQQHPFLPDYNYAELAPLYALAHWGIENGLKAILLMGDGQYNPKEDGHDLKKPFQRLERSNGQITEHLTKAFTDTVDFYTIDKSKWIHFQSLNAYLQKYGNKDFYETFRYWALEDRNLDHIPLFVHRELLVALEKLLGWNHQKVTSKRVEQFIRWSLSIETERHVHACQFCRKALPQPFLEILKDANPSDTPFREKLLYLYNQYAKMADNGCVNRVIRSAFENLRRDDDPAVRYIIHTLDDLPERSVQRPSDVELEVEDHVNHNTDLLMACTVKIQNGQTLGNVRESINGRWLAHSYSPPNDSITAKTKADAENWLVEKCTELVEISVNGGPYIIRRIMSPASIGRMRLDDGPWSPYKIEFVNEAHEVAVSEYIEVRYGSRIPRRMATGTVSLVDGSLVEFGD